MQTERLACAPRCTGGPLLSIRDRIWSDFSFVVSSGYRERVLTSLEDSPKLPRQLAKETNVRVSHVSRSLRELGKRGLVECLTPSARSHGRLYGLTGSGSRVVTYMQNRGRHSSPEGKPPKSAGFVPKIRADSAVSLIRHLKATRGREVLLDALEGWSVDPEELTADTWLTADAFDEFLELLVAKLGNGSYDFLRTLCARVIPTVTSVREQIIKVIPLTALIERAPAVYSREVNYGRIVVKSGHREAAFMHYDWLPAPAFCAAVHGTYEGILRARGVEGTVTKTRCVRSGDDRCEYVVKW